MRFIKHIKAQLCRIDLRYTIFGALSCLLFGLFSLAWSGGAGRIHSVILPPSALPVWAYVVIWTIMYLLLGAAFTQILLSRERYLYSDRIRAGALFIIMFVFNIVWCPLFFGAGAYILSFVDTAIICLLTFFTAYYFSRINTLSAIIMLMYLLWCLYCLYVNLLILLLN